MGPVGDIVEVCEGRGPVSGLSWLSDDDQGKRRCEARWPMALGKEES